MIRWIPLLLIPLLVGPGPVETWILTAETDQTTLPELGFTIFQATKDDAESLQAEFGGKLYRSEVLPLHLDGSVPAINADYGQERTGNQRDGPTVLVIDTGVDALHPDFQDGNLAASVGVERPNGLVGEVIEALTDSSGHGTHLASIVAGTGTGVLGNGEYAGVYANGRVASFKASSLSDPEAVDSIAAIAGIEWAIANRDLYDIRVIVNSWGLAEPFDPDHPINQATLAAYQAGIVVVFSAGNDGDKPNQLNRHCVAPWVLCVAAASNDGRHEGYSSTGSPFPSYNHPDLSAPGSFIRAAKPVLDLRATVLQGVNEAVYIDRSGTSMAAPHVGAAAALLAASNSRLSPDQIMDLLVETTRPMSVNLSVGGSGFLDVEEAFKASASVLGNRAAFLQGDTKYDDSLAVDATQGATGVGTGVDPQDLTLVWLVVGAVGALILVAAVAIILLLRR
ncbi:MAG: S8 family peptidase [Thermoplasmatota archaeon]